MPDISLCQNKTCKARDSCYRFKAKPNPLYQSYAKFGKKNIKKCKYYIKEQK
jgi:hypothetical protein